MSDPDFQEIGPDGEIDDAVLLLELSGDSRMREVSQSLAGVLRTGNRDPIDLPMTSEEALRIHAELSGLGHPESALAADCLMAAVLKEFVERRTVRPSITAMASLPTVMLLALVASPFASGAE